MDVENEIVMILHNDDGDGDGGERLDQHGNGALWAYKSVSLLSLSLSVYGFRFLT